MHDERNPQAEQMAHESMTRTLAAQARAIWPQERELIARYTLPADASIIDVGCGPGEVALRLADAMPRANVLGVDLHPEHIERARRDGTALAPRVAFEVGDAFALGAADDSFDLALCRHMLQAVPTPELVVAELVRVTKPGGVVHLLAEDYAMMHFHPVHCDTDRFWHDGPMTFAERTGSDLRSGRKMFTTLRKAGLDDVRVDYVVVDTGRVPRDVFAEIWIAWRDGYAEAIAAHTSLGLDETRAAFDTMIEAIRDPDGYGVWQVPVISGRLPS